VSGPDMLGLSPARAMGPTGQGPAVDSERRRRRRHVPRRIGAASAGIGACTLALVALTWSSRELPTAYMKDPPGPVALRPKTVKLRDTWTNLPRAPPEEVYPALDIFQRTFPQITTEEHILIRRWEDIATAFGSIDTANDLVQRDPSILRHPNRPRRMLRRLSQYLGPEVARKVALKNPFLLTKRYETSKRTFPALLNVFGTRKRLAEVLLKFPGLVHCPIGDFYKGFPGIVAVTGNPEKATEVAKPAMDRLRRSPHRAYVPEGYATLIAIFGGLEEAHKAINAQPLLFIYYGEQYLPKLLELRKILGRDGAQQALRKAPYLLMPEDQRKVRKIRYAFKAMARIFGEEEAKRRLQENPELFSIGVALQRALGFAERQLGSPEEVAKNFESVMQRTGLQEHIETWEVKQRPRWGYWTQGSGKPLGYGPNPCSWSPYRNPGGPNAPARGQWDEVPEEDPSVVEAEVMDSDGEEEELEPDVVQSAAS